MSLIQRIGSTPEAFALELTIHSVTINIPYPTKLKLVVKRGKTHKDETPCLDHDISLGTLFFDHTILFRVTMFKKNRTYLKKTASFRLIQISKHKSFKNGKGSLDFAKIFSFNTSFERQDIKLKNCSDRNATVCVSAVMTRIDRTASMGSLSTESLSLDENELTDLITSTFINEQEIVEERNNKAVSSTMVAEESNKQKKIEAKEKFKRRLEKLTTIKQQRSNEPQSAYPYQEMESASPSPTMSPQPRRTVNSPYKDPNEKIHADEFKDIKIDDKPEPKPFVLVPIPVIIDEEKPKEQKENSNPNQDRNISALPPTSLQKAKPNSHSKEFEIMAREHISGLSTTNSACACKKCIIF